MITLEPIDPFLRELRLAQATGQRVLAAAAQRRPSGSALQRGERLQRSGELPMPDAMSRSAAGRVEQRAE
jgi:hypothetical protein